MSNMRTIEIDFEIHQQIELERTSFDEAPNDALRRLLKLAPSKSAEEHSSLEVRATGRSWAGKGVMLPHGTDVRMDYNGRVYSGQIDDGEWVVNGFRSKSPSDAAGKAAQTKNGANPSLNGWIYWEVKRPGDGNWRPLRSLRPK